MTTLFRNRTIFIPVSISLLALLVSGCTTTNANTSGAQNVSAPNDSVNKSNSGMTTGGLNNCVIASSDATTFEKAQANMVCDGKADQEEIQAAITDLSPNGGIVQLVGKNFNLSGPIRLYDSSVNNGTGYFVGLRGQRWMKTALNLESHLNCNVINLDAGPILTPGFKDISDLCINGNGLYQDSSGYGISVTTAGALIGDISLNHIWVDNTFSDGFHLLSTWGLRMSECLAESCGGEGIYITGSQGYITNCYSQLNLGNGINVQGDKFIVTGCQVKSSGLNGIKLSSTHNTVSDCIIDNWGMVSIGAAILFSTDDCIANNNQIVGRANSHGCKYGIEFSGNGNTANDNNIQDVADNATVSDGADIYLTAGAMDNVVCDNNLKTGPTFIVKDLSDSANIVQDNTNYFRPR